MLRVMLELFRIIFIFIILEALFGYILKTLYTEAGLYNEKYEWTILLGIFFLIFVLYRNKLQFSGWYKGEGRVKLPKRTTQGFLIISAILISLPVF